MGTVTEEKPYESKQYRVLALLKEKKIDPSVADAVVQVAKRLNANGSTLIFRVVENDRKSDSRLVSLWLMEQGVRVGEQVQFLDYITPQEAEEQRKAAVNGQV